MNPRKIKILEENFDLYWSGKQPYISDERFDQLLEELKKESPNHPLITQLGLSNQRGKKYEHKNLMLSLDKVYSFEDLKKWVLKNQRDPNERYVVQYKFDGLAGKLINGVLATRGDGRVGEDISRHKNHIQLIRDDKRIPLIKIRNKEKEILGEIIVSNKKFEEFRISEFGTYAHPRNFVAGLINSKDWLNGVTLDFVEYSTSKREIIDARNFTKDRWEALVKDFRRSAIYPTDGLVIKLEDERYAKSLGNTSHHPLGQIAFKFSGETAQTKILEINWQNGKNSITPVALIEKVMIKNIAISKVTLHNAGFVKGMNIAKGDKITIERAGDVIPHILSVDEKGSDSYNIPLVCPCCGSVIDWRGPEIYCTNENCPGTRRARLMAALRYFNIDGLGDVVMNYLIFNGVITSPEQIFKISYDQLLHIPGFAETSANNLLKAINEAKEKVTYPVILGTLNTEGVGKVTYKKILEHMTFAELVNEEKELLNIPGINEKRAISIRKSIKDNLDYLRRITEIIQPKEEVSVKGKKICFTGKMEKPRKYYEQLALEHNYIPSDKVDKTLDLLVTTEMDRQSSKMMAARKYGIKIIELNQWLEEL